MSHLIMPAPTANIPLHCNICPKKPDFSDVSHLLTHIQSKGHLSSYYKMKVKADSDPAIKQLVDYYDEWYDDWGVQDMMRERMKQKEKKNGTANGHAHGSVSSRKSSAANSVVSVSSRNTPARGLPSGRRTQALRTGMLDPQLGPKVKIEPRSRSATPANPLAFDPAALHRAYAPPMQSWPATPYADSPMTQDHSVFSSLYSTPSSDSPEIELPKRGNTRNKRRNLSGSNDSNTFVEDELENDYGVDKNTKLKGKLWEGMGLFDSATQEMRRKRNQKKEISVILQLKATSDVVEPKECVFDADGECMREREITGNPNEDDGFSPLKGESSPEVESPVKPKKKTARRPRPALVEKEVNSGRTLRRRASHHPPFGNSKRGPYFDGGDEEDDDMTYGQPLPRKRTGISIHRDNSGPDITFDQPAPLNTLTSAFRHPFQINPFQQQTQPSRQTGFGNRSHQRQPSFPFGTGFRPANNNPLNGVPPPNIGSFGQLSGQSMFHNAAVNNNNPFANGHQAMTAFQQHFGIGQQPFGNDAGLFTGQNNNGVQCNNPWDIFNFGAPDFGFPNIPDAGFSANADFNPFNPLFFSSNKAGPEDDEATISPPGSEH